MAKVHAPAVWLGLSLLGCSNFGQECHWTKTCDPPSDGGSAAGGSSGSAGSSSGASGANGGVAGFGGGAGGAAGTQGDAGEGSESGGAGGAGGEGPGSCEAWSVDDEACITEDYGVFVSSSGSDGSGDGTRAKPFASITRAVEEAATIDEPRRLFVCAAVGKPYKESVTLGPEVGGLELYGGFSCESWQHDPSRRAELHSPDPVAWVVRDLHGLTIENVVIKAAAALESGTSSLGLLVDSSDSVRLRNVQIIAGAAAAGPSGENGVPGGDGRSPEAQQRGASAECPSTLETQSGGSWDSTSFCGSRGGAGGPARAGENGFSGASGQPNTNVVIENTSNAGPPGGAGLAGSPGKAGLAGAATTIKGSFTAEGFAAASAAGSGSPGFPGQGGGGGGSSDAVGECIGATGGAGGMGGCGGLPGMGGAGGGASVALLSWSSSVTLENCRLTAGGGGAGGRGGNGGAGGKGSAGAEGGAGLASEGIVPGGKGGPGGAGGVGGPGAGGNGGPSHALVYRGQRPIEAGVVELVAGSAGAAGPGGTSGDLTAPSGQPGASAKVFQVQ